MKGGKERGIYERNEEGRRERRVRGRIEEGNQRVEWER